MPSPRHRLLARLPASLSQYKLREPRKINGVFHVTGSTPGKTDVTRTVFGLDPAIFALGELIAQGWTQVKVVEPLRGYLIAIYPKQEQT